LAQAGYDELANAARDAWIDSAPAGPVTGEDIVEDASLEINNEGIGGVGITMEAQSDEARVGDNNLGNW
jgi:hypothetical protein